MCYILERDDRTLFSASASWNYYVSDYLSGLLIYEKYLIEAKLLFFNEFLPLLN